MAYTEEQLKQVAAHVEAGELAVADEKLAGLDLAGESLPARLHRLELTASLAEARSDYAAAAECMAEAVGLEQEAWGAPTPRRLLRLAGLFRRAAPEKAEQLIDRAEGIARREHSLDHPAIAMCFAERARLAQEQGDYEEAQAFFKKAVNALDKGDLPATYVHLRADYQLELAEASVCLLDFESTFAAAQEALNWYAGQEASFQKVANIKLRIADHYRFFGQLDQSLSLYRELLHHAQTEAPNTRWIPLLYNRIGLALEQQKLNNEALQAYYTAFLLQKDLGAELNDMRWTAERIVDVEWAITRAGGTPPAPPSA